MALDATDLSSTTPPAKTPRKWATSPPDRLRSLIERIERLEEEKKALSRAISRTSTPKRRAPGSTSRCFGN